MKYRLLLHTLGLFISVVLPQSEASVIAEKKLDNAIQGRVKRCVSGLPSEATQAGAKGKDLVTAIVSKVEEALGSSKGLLLRTALVESNYGLHSDTYRSGYHGGVFQVDRVGFEDTQDVSSHPRLPTRFATIKASFGIDWPQVVWLDLRKPLYSAIAARLVYLNVPAAIPSKDDILGQGNYWKTYYNSAAGAGSATKFRDRVLEEEGGVQGLPSEATQAGAKGKDLVTAIVSKVEEALGSSKGLLLRTALVESDYGLHSDTYRSGYHGGVFQVDRVGFEDTQDVSSHPRLPTRFATIKAFFGIDWPQVVWLDLRKPLYSAISARLVYLNVPATIPSKDDILGQGNYWKTYYNSAAGAGSATKFRDRVLEEEGGVQACDLRTYNASVFQGKTIKVHNQFVSSMDRIKSYADTCTVKVYVTSSFRKRDVPISGAIVPPASRSNHFVGHAIDMNVIDSSGWCNSKCLIKESSWTEGVKCFIGKIRADSGLRWGGDFNTPDTVHIDDGINLRDPPSYDTIYATLQRNC